MTRNGLYDHTARANLKKLLHLIRNGLQDYPSGKPVRTMAPDMQWFTMGCMITPPVNLKEL